MVFKITCFIFSLFYLIILGCNSTATNKIPDGSSTQGKIITTENTIKAKKSFIIGRWKVFKAEPDIADLNDTGIQNQSEKYLNKQVIFKKDSIISLLDNFPHDTLFNIQYVDKGVLTLTDMDSDNDYILKFFEHLSVNFSRKFDNGNSYFKSFNKDSIEQIRITYLNHYNKRTNWWTFDKLTDSLIFTRIDLSILYLKKE